MKSRADRLVIPASPESGGGRLVEPTHRIVNQIGDHTTPEKRHCRECKGTDKYRLPKGRKACMAVDHDERISPGRRMDCLGKKHVAKSEHLGERIDPQRVAKALIASYANQSAPYVTAKK